MKSWPSIYRTDLQLQSAAISVGKTPELNEDSYFVSSNSIGVADGVGSIKHRVGVTSADFSSELMTLCNRKSRDSLSCREIIIKAFREVVSGGSAAYILATLNGLKLQILNLGDCGVRIFRRNFNGWIQVFQSNPLQHSFNTPF